MKAPRLALTLTLVLTAATAAFAADWPQWRGPNRDGVSKETGLLKQWPADGPKLDWKAESLGGGYGTVSVVKGRIYGMGYRNPDEAVWCLNAADGKLIWAQPLAQANRRGKGYGDGSRCTPTVDGKYLYVVGDSGDIACMDAATGAIRWKKDMVDDFGGKVPQWGYAESPLVDGNQVIFTPGGPQASLVALNKMTGEVIWKAVVPGGDGAQYASPIIANVGGQKEYVTFMQRGLVAVSAADGKFLWRYDHPASGTANICTPIAKGDMVFGSAAYNIGSGVVKLTPGANGVTAEEAYFTRDLKSKHGGVVLVGDYLYGFDDPGTLTCVEFKTGKVMWKDRSIGGNASVFYADGMLYCRSQRGDVALVEANPQMYVAHGTFMQPDRRSQNAWAHPVVANGKMYLRDQDILFCYDVKAP